MLIHFPDGKVFKPFEIKENMYVDYFFQSQGIGAQLIAFAVNEKKCDYLWVLEKNVRAISFYERHGFLLSGERLLEEGTTEFLVKLERKV